MKTKRVLSFICILTLVVSLCSVFSFATQPETEAEIESEITPRYIGDGKVISTRTYLYNRASTSSGYVFNGNIPVQTRVTIHSITNDGEFYYVTGTVSQGTFSGYVETSHVILI